MTTKHEGQEGEEFKRKIVIDVESKPTLPRDRELVNTPSARPNVAFIGVESIRNHRSASAGGAAEEGGSPARDSWDAFKAQFP